VIAGAARRSWTGRRPTRPARPARGVEAGEHVPARLAALAGDDADAPRQPRPLEALLRLEQALGGERRRSASTWASRSPSPATRRPVTSNENDGDDVREPG
jgi:hypothetical protein